MDFKATLLSVMVSHVLFYVSECLLSTLISLSYADEYQGCAPLRIPFKFQLNSWFSTEVAELQFAFEFYFLASVIWI